MKDFLGHEMVDLSDWLREIKYPFPFQTAFLAVWWQQKEELDRSDPSWLLENRHLCTQSEIDPDQFIDITHCAIHIEGPWVDSSKVHSWFSRHSECRHADDFSEDAEESHIVIDWDGSVEEFFEKTTVCHEEK